MTPAPDLQFLDFDVSDNADGQFTWNALATVSEAQWPALRTEAQALLRWAHAHLDGQPGPWDEGGDWDVDLQLQRELVQNDTLDYDALHDRLIHTQAAQGHTRYVLSLTLSGGPALDATLREALGHA